MTEHAQITAALAAAAAAFESEEFGAQFYGDDEEKLPRALYVQRGRDGPWRAAFRPAEDMDAEMTRWATDDEARRIFSQIMDAQAIAADIADGWDSDWDE